MIANWTTAAIAQLTEKVGSGATPLGGEAAYKPSGTPLIRSMNVVFFGFKRDGLAFIDEYQASALDGATVRAHDNLLNITGASIGRVTLAPQDMDGARVNQHVCIIRPNLCIDSRYLRAYLSSPTFQAKIWADNTGTTRQALTKQQILGFEVPVAPLAEQRRIADKLDIVLARVDAVNDRIARVTPLLKRFRQSVLAAATSGKLTDEWRSLQEVPAPKAVLLGNVIKVSSGDGLTAKEMQDGQVPVFGGNGINGYHNNGNTFESKIVIGRVGYYCGSVHLTPPISWVTDNALIVRFNEEQVSREFLYYGLRGTDLRQNTSSTAQPVISGQKIYSLPFSLPDPTEQSEIVRRVELLFSFADRLELRLQAAQTAAERLTPALLAKAFRGELVPQDPNDEPASELLRRLRKVVTPGTAKQIKRKAK